MVEVGNSELQPSGEDNHEQFGYGIENCAIDCCSRLQPSADEFVYQQEAALFVELPPRS